MLVSAIGCLAWVRNESLGEMRQAWIGIIGGFLAWTYSEVSHEIGFIAVEKWDGAMLLLLAGLVTAVLWSYFPLGAQFWLVIFLLNWTGHVIILMEEHLIAPGGTLDTVFLLTMITSGLIAIGALYWIFFKSSTRIQRLWGAAILWQALSLIIFIARR